jgi:hypothetical protein
MREEPPNGTVLQEGPLLDPEVADESLATITHTLDEIRREGSHLPSEGENEWKGDSRVSRVSKSASKSCGVATGKKNDLGEQGYNQESGGNNQ